MALEIRVAGDHKHGSALRKDLRHQACGDATALHRILSDKALSARVFNIRVKCNDRHALPRQCIDALNESRVFGRHQGNTGTSGFSQFIKCIDRGYRVNTMNRFHNHFKTVFLNLVFRFLNPLKYTFDEWSIRSLYDHSEAQVRFRQCERPPYQIALIPHLLCNPHYAFCHFRIDTSSVVKRSVYRAP